MPIFIYQYVQKDGSSKREIIEAESQRSALSNARQPGRKIISLREATITDRVLYHLNKDIPFHRILPLRQQAELAKSLSTLLASGLTLEQSLEILSKSDLSKALLFYVKSTLSEVRRGYALSKALEKQSLKLDPYFLGLIKIAEDSGGMERCIKLGAEALLRKQKAKSELINALIYPTVLAFVSIVSFGFLFIFVIPQLKSIFLTSGNETPLLTKAILQVSDFLIAALPALPIIFVVVVASLIATFVNQRGRHKLHQLVLKLPLIGRIFQLIELSLFSRGLSVALSVGIVASEAIQISAQNLRLLPYKNATSTISADVRQGQSFAKGMADFGSLFPDYYTQMVHVGEQSGRLSETLTYLADLTDDELQRSRTMLTSLLTPLFLVVFGGLTAIVMFAVWSSVLNLNDVVLS